ncbi:MAG: SUF system Fe-S cluster assembly protein [Thiohalobacteraceae bacterium]
MFERAVRTADLESKMDNPKGEAITGDTLQEQIISALRTVYDPEIPVNIFELGLIYVIKIVNSKDIHIEMTLTAPACPVAGSMPGAVERAVKRVPGVEKVDVELVWEPAWGPERMSDEARLELGMF